MGKVTRLFDAENAARLAREHPLTPTGVLYCLGGVEFNLMPFTYGEFLDIQDLIPSLAKSFIGLQNGNADDGLALLSAIPGVFERIEEHLAKSPGVCDQGTAKEQKEDRARFSAWLKGQNLTVLVRTLWPKLQEVLANRPLETEAESAPTLKSV